MSTVQFVDGRIVEGVKLTDVQSVGDEGSRRAIAHLDGKTYPVFNSIVDGFDPVWYEQVQSTLEHDVELHMSEAEILRAIREETDEEEPTLAEIVGRGFDEDEFEPDQCCDICGSPEATILVGLEGVPWAFKTCGEPACEDKASEMLHAALERREKE